MTESVNNLAFARQNSVEPARPTGVNALTQADFLRLLTTQLTHQDPTEPLDNEQFVAQMAQFSTVSGIEKLNAGLAGLGDKLDDRVGTATALIGKAVLVPGAVAAPDAAGRVAGAIELPVAADRLVVAIADAAGNPVREFALDATRPGLVGFAWDGRDANGRVVAGDIFRVAARASRGGAEVPVPTHVWGVVRAVALSGDGAPPSLDVAGVGAASVAQVRQIRGG